MKQELNNVASTSNSEVDLFRHMSAILSQYYHVSFVGETHQQYVAYHSTQINQTATREISDLWIIAFSPNQQKARMTFLQAKYKRSNLNHQQPDFAGEYFQYELLSQRPVLTAVLGQRYHFPPDVLSFSCCDSIGSYGVFYIDTNNEIDMAYCSASHLTASSVLPLAYAQAAISLQFPGTANVITLCTLNQCQELISTFDIDDFTNALLRLEVGGEITFDPGIMVFVRNVLQQYATDPAIGQLLNFIDNQKPESDNPDNVVFDGMPVNLLVINVDGKEGEW